MHMPARPTPQPAEPTFPPSPGAGVPEARRHRSSRRPACGLVRRLAGGLAVLSLGACGGGLYVDVGDGYDDDDRPTVSLSATPTEAAPGDTVLLEADARDDYGVDSVTLYREVGSGSIELGRQYRRPYEFLVTVPSSAGSQLAFYVVARDDVGQSSSSRTVIVDVLR